MKPQSIRRFDLFFLASLCLLTLGLAMSFDTVVAAVQTQTSARGLQVGSGLVLGIFAVVLAVDLVLWRLVSSKGSAVAKWILVVLLVLDLLGIPSLLSGGLSTSHGISLLRIASEAVAIAFLFKADAKAWFTRAEAVPATPDADDSGQGA
jgi:hypothetical protein